MHLHPCSRPTGRLETAPRTALRVDSAQEQWEGYWDTTDEAYYARCVHADGSDQWYRLVDEGTTERAAQARVLVLRRRGARRTDLTRMAVFTPAAHSGRRTVLVGTWRRRAAVERGGSR